MLWKLSDGTSLLWTIYYYISRLKVLEGEIDEWIPKYDDLQSLSKQLAQSADRDATLELDEQMQRVRDRWDALVQRMEQRSCEVSPICIKSNIHVCTTASISVMSVPR